MRGAATDLLVHDPVDLASSPQWREALLRNPVPRSRLHQQVDPSIRLRVEDRLELADAEVDDLGDLRGCERVEDDLLVEAVQL